MRRGATKCPGGAKLQARLPANRLVRMTIGLFAPVLISLLAIFWVWDHVDDWVWWQVGLIFLIVLEIAYVLTVALVIPAALILGFLVLSRRGTAGRSAVGRWCLLCVSLLCGIIAAETVCAVWRHAPHRSTALPPEGPRSLAAFFAAHPPIHRARDSHPPRRATDPEDKSAINIVVLGESSAEGVPFAPRVSVGGIVGWQLEEAMPARPVHVWNFAVSGATLERQHERLLGATLRPDAVIIYCGHNELSSRFAHRALPAIISTINSRRSRQPWSAGSKQRPRPVA